MTVTELFNQAKAISPQERRELAQMLMESADADSAIPQSEAHWGQSLNRLLDELGPIDLIHPEIDDPVEWVKQIRREQDEKRLGDWGKDA